MKHGTKNRTGFFLFNIIKFIMALAVIYFFMYLTSLDNYYTYFAAVILISIPVIFYSCMKTTIAKTSRLIGMNNPEKGNHIGSFYYRITKRKNISYIINIIAGLFFGFTIPVFLITLNTYELLIVAGILVLAFIIKNFIYAMKPIYDDSHEIKNQILRAVKSSGIAVGSHLVQWWEGL